LLELSTFVTVNSCNQPTDQLPINQLTDQYISIFKTINQSINQLINHSIEDRPTK